jgi:TIGR03009 family protein
LRTLIAWTLTLAVGASASAQGTAPATRKPPAKAAQPQAAPVDPNVEKARLEAEAQNREAMDRVLAEWEKQSKKVNSLDVLFDRVDVGGAAWGNQYYQGRAMLQSPDLACLQFQKYKVDKDGKPVFVKKDGKSLPDLEPEPYERIVCTGKEVLQYSWDDRKIFVFPLDKQSRQKALQQGPLPFLFNMKAVDAKKRYSMTLLPQKDANTDNYLIGIMPNEQIDKQSFDKAFLWLSKKTFLPNRLRLYTPGGKEYQEFVFTGNSNAILANQPMDQGFFAFRGYKGWKVIENPGGEPGAQKVEPGIGQPARKAAAQPNPNPNNRPR